MTQPSSLIEQLAHFDAARGKDPIDPTRIEGFGPGAAPAPAVPTEPHIPSAREGYGEPVELPEQVPVGFTSPLVAAGLAPQAVVTPNETHTPILPPLELAVMDDRAVYREWPVTLNTTEKSAIVRVILKAVRRELDERYLAVAGVRPRIRQPAASAVDQSEKPRVRVKRKSLLRDPA